MKKRSAVIKMIPIYCTVTLLLFLISIKGNQAVTTYFETEQQRRTSIVVIDPGHGGVDGGATSYSGVLEKSMNLEISMRLNDLFHLLGIETLMIRTTDDSIHTTGKTIAQKKVSDLRERVRIINELDSAFLISIHQNYFTDSRYYGPQVFYKTGQGSKRFATRLQSTMTELLAPDSNRKSKEASKIYLLDHITCDGVLVECGFLSNPQEDQKLKDPNYQQKICAIIATEYIMYSTENRIS